MFDPIDDLTTLEAMQAEEASGQSLMTLFDDAPKLRIQVAVAWLHARRTEPGLTYEEYAARTKPAEVYKFLIPKDDEAAPEVDERDPFRGEPAEGGEPEGPVREGEGAVLPPGGHRAE